MLIIYFILLGYSLLVIFLIIGWIKCMTQRPLDEAQVSKFISVIIPFRNEEKHIGKLLASLRTQVYQNFEIIAIDDHSTDRSVEICQAAYTKNIRLLKNPGQGKKSAITHGVYQAKGEVIVTTDADCTMPEHWLETINRFFHDEQLVMLFGAVRLHPSTTFFSNLQAMEFSSLIGSGAATTTMGRPTMCNGANLAYRKNAFVEVNGYAGNYHVASGDDEFLMRKIHQIYPRGIQFAASEKVIVDSEAQPDIRSFFNQRIRWASKWSANSSKYTVALAVFILSSQLATLWALISLLTSVSPLLALLLLFKAITEGIFLNIVCRFLKVRWNWWAFMVLQVAYPIYVISIGIISNFVSYSWKDRRIT